MRNLSFHEKLNKCVVVFYLQVETLLALLNYACFSTEETRQLYRDLMGFMIADKERYFQITIEK